MRMPMLHVLATVPVLGAALVVATPALVAETAPALAALPQHGSFLEKHCFECHDDVDTEGDLNLLEAPFDLTDEVQFTTWAHVYDRIHAGEMPPKKKKRPDQQEMDQFLAELADALNKADHQRIADNGRGDMRRLNRFEYENALRDILRAPWLMVAEDLPADGMADLFSKSSQCLDISHVQMMKFLDVGERALRTAVNAAAYPPETKRYYARNDQGFSYIHRGGIRSNVPVIGYDIDMKVFEKKGHQSDPKLKDEEGIATFYGAHPAFTRCDFTKMNPPIDGQYRLRLMSYTIGAGNRGYDGKGIDPTKPPKNKKSLWFRPNKLDLRKGVRTEPITLYGLSNSGETRWLTAFDAQIEPGLSEHVVTLRKGEGIRPDPARLVRLRPGFDGNFNVEDDYIPGWTIQWMEVEGPLSEQWPPASYQALFGDMPFEVDDMKRVTVQSNDEAGDARRLLKTFAKQAWRGREVTTPALDRCVAIYTEARELGNDFTDAMITAFNAVLMSPQFLYLESNPGPLDGLAMAERLSLFLWNGVPDDQLLALGQNLTDASTLRLQTDRLLSDQRSDRFVQHFLDFWLDLQSMNNTVPDSDLYPDYFLDGQLAESSVLETRLFFRALIDDNLPIRNLIDSDFTYLNERLAKHYEVPYASKSVKLERVRLPKDSARGGLLTQASILKVSANGTTTSPVLRGLWIAERVLGVHVGNPPSGIEAIEPDTRGAITIRDQLARHTEVASCAACHAKFDPVGFALESFDVMGGWRDRYRALTDEKSDRVKGYGMNGHAFEFSLAQKVESHSQLLTGENFNDIHELKQLLLRDDRALARNFVNRLVAYATGAPVTFADRPEVDAILDATAKQGYRVRDLLDGVIASNIFGMK